MKARKNIALVAHDNRKSDMVEWVAYNWGTLIKNSLICTGTTGALVEKTLKEYADPDCLIDILKLKSGPLGGDQQLGAMIAEGKVDMMIFLWDPMEPQPHDVDVKALLRIASLYNIPTATNRSTADFIISSPLMDRAYTPVLKNYSEYINRLKK